MCQWVGREFKYILLPKISKGLLFIMLEILPLCYMRDETDFNPSSKVSDNISRLAMLIFII